MTTERHAGRLAAAVVVLALAALGGARVARQAAEHAAPRLLADEPYAPAPDTAPLVALGYRELFADLLFLRLKGYFGGRENTANGVWLRERSSCRSAPTCCTCCRTQMPI